jgi:hypothetical protein
MGAGVMNPLKSRRQKSIPAIEPANLRALIAQATGLAPIDQTDDADVFVCGYPKSGNTWFQHLIAGLVFGCNGQYTSDTLIQTIVPDVSYLKFYTRFQTPSFFKTHLLPQGHYKRIVHLLRDGRDVMVSYYHHQCAMTGSQVDFLKMIRNEKDLFPCSWAQHVQAYLSLAGCDMLLIRYEDLLSDTVRELQRFCRFVGIDRPAALLESVAQKADFQALKEKENSPLWVRNPQWDPNKAFIRRGIVGSYKDEMPGEVLDAFLQQAGPTLSKCGYL